MPIGGTTVPGAPDVRIQLGDTNYLNLAEVKVFGEDTTKHIPDPMTWATVPYATGCSTISMIATAASDTSGVEYYFECTAGGGHNSGWQDSNGYTDIGLSPATSYTYRVQARDKSCNHNTTGWSSSLSAITEECQPPYLQDSGSDGIVSMEAEHYYANIIQGSHSWTLITSPTGCSGGYAMQANPDNITVVDTDYVTGSPRLDFSVNFVKTGAHYIWIRGHKTGGADDSLHAGLDNQALSSCDRISNFSGSGWAWTSTTLDNDKSRATFNVKSPGVHTVNIWMREDGFSIDKIVLTTNPNYTPTGTGPVESP
jgi:hypothetical protein